MTSVKLSKDYEDDKTYPMLIKLNGYHAIREMSGKDIKTWNLNCSDCAMENLHQPCEACPNNRSIKACDAYNNRRK